MGERRIIHYPQKRIIGLYVMYDKDSYHLQNVEYIYMTKANRNQIKQKLMEYGAAECSMYAPETSSDKQMYGNTGKSNFTAYYCDDTSKTTNHSVLIVGWDDNYSASNFNPQCRPFSDGAWLIRNSWGNCNNMGGNVKALSLPFFKKLQTTHLSGFETRKIIFSAPEARSEEHTSELQSRE